MRKRMMTICLALIALLVFPVMTAYADEFQGADGWKVTYDGSSLASNFKAGDLSEAIGDLQPDDSITFTINVESQSGEETNWWLSNEVIKSFEDNSKASDGAYTYHLVYTDSKGKDTVLYDSDTVGGENRKGGEGLHQATGALKDYFLLETMKGKGTGKVVLTVALDGETQGNAYQNANAVIDLTFAVEKAGKVSTVKTGDPTDLHTVYLIAAAAAVVLLLLVLTRSRKQRKEGSNE